MAATIQRETKMTEQKSDQAKTKEGLRVTFMQPAWFSRGHSRRSGRLVVGVLLHTSDAPQTLLWVLPRCALLCLKLPALFPESYKTVPAVGATPGSESQARMAG